MRTAASGAAAVHFAVARARARVLCLASRAPFASRARSAGARASSSASSSSTGSGAGASGTSGAGARGGATGSGSGSGADGDANARLAVYATAVAVAVGGASYAAVPLYKAFCQATGYGGTTQQASEAAFRAVRPVPGARPVTVAFSADTAAAMPWTFRPQQGRVSVVPGETALAFYTAHNPTDRPVTGVSTYNITPMKAGLYFNKIQCFCFAEQRLRPHEEVDMPVFFYIDPAFADDPAMDNVKTITLSYTFFRVDDHEVLDASPELEAAARAHRAGVPPSAAAPAAVDGRGAGAGAGAGAPLTGDAAAARVAAWTAEMAGKTGVRIHGNAALPAPPALPPPAPNAPGAAVARDGAR